MKLSFMLMVNLNLKEVFIEGKVINPGTYALMENMSLGDLILATQVV